MKSLALSFVALWIMLAHTASADESPKPSAGAASGPDGPPLVAAGGGLKQAFGAESINGTAIAMTVEIRPIRALSLGLSGALFAPFGHGYDVGPSAPLRTQTLGSFASDIRGFVVGTHDRRAELYLFGGVGYIAIRSIAVRDPSRTFDWEMRTAFSSGLGGRFELGRRIALFAETRVTTFINQLENRLVDPTSPKDRNTWFGEKPLTNMVDLQVGLLALFPR